MGHNAFIHPITSALKCHGFIESNDPGDLKIPVVDDFSLAPGAWQWNGAAWMPYVPPPPLPTALAQALDTAITTPTPANIKAVFQTWRQQVS